MLFLAFVLNALAIMGSILFLITTMMLDHINHNNAFRSFQVFDSNRKVGGIRFLRLGRLNLSFSISKAR